jgi:hypothetical protein
MVMTMPEQDYSKTYAVAAISFIVSFIVAFAVCFALVYCSIDDSQNELGEDAGDKTEQSAEQSTTDGADNRNKDIVAQLAAFGFVNICDIALPAAGQTMNLVSVDVVRALQYSQLVEFVNDFIADFRRYQRVHLSGSLAGVELFQCGNLDAVHVCSSPTVLSKRIHQ